MAQENGTFKKIGRQVWDLFKGAFLTSLMFMSAGALLVVICFKGETSELQWTNAKMIWTIVCVVCATAYAGLMSYINGGNGYEMLVAGNMRRMSSSAGTGLKISKYVYEKEYRVWKGFGNGAFVAIVPIVAGIFFGANQGKIDGVLSALATGAEAQSVGVGFGSLMVIFLFVSGYSILPFLLQNIAGAGISYYYGCLFGLLPLVVIGVMYIVGAYGRRAKTIRKQEIADREAEAEASRQKKINYGGLPGTKPKKRK